MYITADALKEITLDGLIEILDPRVITYLLITNQLDEVLEATRTGESVGINIKLSQLYEGHLLYLFTWRKSKERYTYWDELYRDINSYLKTGEINGNT